MSPEGQQEDAARGPDSSPADRGMLGAPLGVVNVDTSPSLRPPGRPSDRRGCDGAQAPVTQSLRLRAPPGSGLADWSLFCRAATASLSGLPHHQCPRTPAGDRCFRKYICSLAFQARLSFIIYSSALSSLAVIFTKSAGSRIPSHLPLPSSPRGSSFPAWRGI